jgi:hypothetical protein
VQRLRAPRTSEHTFTYKHAHCSARQHRTSELPFRPHHCRPRPSSPSQLSRSFPLNHFSPSESSWEQKHAPFPTSLSVRQQVPSAILSPLPVCAGGEQGGAAARVTSAHVTAPPLSAKLYYRIMIFKFTGAYISMYGFRGLADDYVTTN